MLKIITYNVLFDKDNKTYRLKKLLKIILLKEPTIIFLQEIVTNKAKKVVIDIFKEKYKIFFSDNYELNSFPYESYIPSIMSFGCLCISVFFDFILLAYLFLILILLFFPYFTLFFTKYFNKHLNMMYNNKMDMMGLCTLILKDEFTSIKLITSKPYKYHAYEWEFSLERWFSITFIRPGYMFIKAKHKELNTSMLLCNSHTTLGYENEKRINQINELIMIMNKESDGIAFIGMDMNTNKGSSFLEMNKNNIKNINQNYVINTWDTNNVLVQNSDNKEISYQCDYIWYKLSKSFRLSNANTIKLGEGHNVSDHYGLLSIFELRNKYKKDFTFDNI
jgi:endonuclease/exonuclease/phosphatase family metal-dependent hydrolase